MAELRDGLAGLARLRPAVPAEPQAEPQKPKMDAQGRAYATGRRKDAVARVWLKPGTGKFTVNGKIMGDYFARPTLQMIIGQPFDVINRLGQYDVMCTVAGGGLSGQAGAVRHGLSRALITYDPRCARCSSRRLPDPRRPRGRAQEVRQGQGPPQLPVQQALICLFGRSGKGRHLPALFRCSGPRRACPLNAA